MNREDAIAAAAAAARQAELADTGQLFSADEYLRDIEAWVDDAARDSGMDADEIYSDIVHAYLDSEVGTATEEARAMRTEILRRTGVGERAVDWNDPWRLDGCTCGGIGNTGSHRPGCPWAASRRHR